MQQIDSFLLTLGSILCIALFASEVGRRTQLPRVTLLLICGMLIGESGFSLIPSLFQQQFELVSTIALLMLGFLLGGRLTVLDLKLYGLETFTISLSAALFACFIVTFGLWLLNVPLPLAIICGCIASATDPAAVYDVVVEQKTQSYFSKKLLAIVAIDDAWALILFSLGAAIASAMLSTDHSAWDFLWEVNHELGGGVVLGCVLGGVGSMLTGRLKTGQPMLIEALALVFICGGLALYFNVSFLIAAMVMGAVIANFANHHEYAFHEIENIEWPFMATFFVLAGASLQLSALLTMGMIGGAYVVLRVLGKVFGAYLGARLIHAGSGVRQFMGLALIPQAGVAIGLGLIASHYFPQYSQIILPLVVSTTVLFELVGPFAVKYAVKKTS